jgi:Predicted nucleotide-binding protein containing TIR-like domain
VGHAFGGSWLGYHSTVYYLDFQPPPPGARFSPEWGLMETFCEGTYGDWVEFSREDVKSYIQKLAGRPSLDQAKARAEESKKLFESAKSDLISLLSASLSETEDSYIRSLKKDVENADLLTPSDVVGAMRPSGQYMSRDSTAVTQGVRVPPHCEILGEVILLRQGPIACRRLGEMAQKAGSHLQRMSKKQKRAEMVGTNVFIGHGRSYLWKDLKDFIQDRLNLPWDEFNRVPVAGITNIARLSEMLEAAAIAFLVMTAEDEQADGNHHARMNVIHEAGLFQGRLGFARAIILLEEGCQEFSNVQGLGQIRFPKGNIKAAFEEIRQVLEREGLVT